MRCKAAYSRPRPSSPHPPPGAIASSMRPPPGSCGQVPEAQLMPHLLCPLCLGMRCTPPSAPLPAPLAPSRTVKIPLICYPRQHIACCTDHVNYFTWYMSVIPRSEAKSDQRVCKQVPITFFSQEYTYVVPDCSNIGQT